MTSVHFTVSGRRWRAPARALSRLPRAPSSSSATLPHHAHACTHTYAHTPACWLSMLTDCHTRTKCFPLRPARYSRERHTVHPRGHGLPLLPARDTAREQLEYLCLTKKTCSSPCLLPVLSAQPASWCSTLSLSLKPQPW